MDDDRGHYLLLDLGWNDEKYLHATPIHLDLIGSQIWIQYDDTEEGVATDLLEAGIPRQDIVLGFRHPKIRPYTGFAVSNLEEHHHDDRPRSHDFLPSVDDVLIVASQVLSAMWKLQFTRLSYDK